MTPRHRERIWAQLEGLAFSIGRLARDIPLVEREIGPEAAKPLRALARDQVQEAQALTSLLLGAGRDSPETDDTAYAHDPGPIFGEV